MQAVEEDVTKDAPMDSTDLPEDDLPQEAQAGGKPAARPAARVGGGGHWAPVQFARDVRLEMKKVTWPSRSEVVSTTVVVMIAVVFFAAYLWGVDNLLELFFHQLEQWLH
jgi:preprotein translocase subunit SecE